MKSLLWLQICISAIFVLSCSPSPDNMTESSPDGAPSLEEEFNYQTIQAVNVVVYSDYAGVEFTVKDEVSKKLAVIKTDNAGFVSLKISVPRTNEGLFLVSSYIGIPNEIYVPIENNKAEINLMQSAQLPNNGALQKMMFSENNSFSSYNQSDGFPAFGTMGNWDRYGVPEYLTNREPISSDIIKTLNEILPEKQPVPDYRPQYLMENLDTDLHLLKDGEVFITFVHEGAGYRNTLGYYTYKTADGPPSSLSDSEIKIVFPNVSYRYSGGGLTSGDTVSLGEHTAGTSIGWVLKSNAFSTRFKSVSNGFNTFFSENSLNRDEDPHKQHFVQINLGDLIVIGIEDLLRPGGDNDFNDAVFTVRSTPEDAIDRSGLVVDTDPNYTEPTADPDDIELQEAPLFDISGYQFFPGKDEFGTLAYEDLWPHKGDYDFNDLVVDYNVIEALDKDNKIVQIQLSLRIVGILASMHNGFGVQLGIAPELVASVSGARHTKGYTKINSNGTEKRQERAVIIAFEDAQEHYNAASPDDSELIVISINLTRGVSRTELGFAPYNPFIMSNGERGREIHLPGYQATNLVHIPYFGSVDDDSVIGTNYMYKTNDDLPWAIHLPEKFSYPYDSVRINSAYKLFDAWVASDGFSHSDWYTDKTGYRISDMIKRK